jgi:SSS family solute:Na+ symporter
LKWLNTIGFAVKNANGIYEIPFIDRMGFVFILCAIGMIIISLRETKRGVVPNAMEIDRSMFRLSNGFIVGMLVILSLLVALYTIFW